MGHDRPRCRGQVGGQTEVVEDDVVGLVAGLQQPSESVAELGLLNEPVGILAGLVRREECSYILRGERSSQPICLGINQRPTVVDAAGGVYRHGLGIAVVVVPCGQVISEDGTGLIWGVAPAGAGFAGGGEPGGKAQRGVANLSLVPVGVGDQRGAQDSVVVSCAASQPSRVGHAGRQELVGVVSDSGVVAERVLPRGSEPSAAAGLLDVVGDAVLLCVPAREVGGLGGLVPVACQRNNEVFECLRVIRGPGGCGPLQVGGQRDRCITALVGAGENFGREYEIFDSCT